MDDIVAVMDAAGSAHAAVFAMLDGGAMAALFAATHPERVDALVLYEAQPRMSWAPDYDWAMPSSRMREAFIRDGGMADWGQGKRILRSRPERRSPPAAAGVVRQARAAVGESRHGGEADADERPDRRPRRAARRSRRRRSCCTGPSDPFVDIRHSRYLAEHIPGARMVELPGNETLGVRGAGAAASSRRSRSSSPATRHEPDPERVLATVMFTDIVDSTRRAAELGDRRWRELLEAATAGDRRGSSSASGGGRSRRSATGCWPHSTGRPGRSAARSRCASCSARSSASRSAPACTPARSS